MNKEAEVVFYPTLRDILKSFASWNIETLRPFALLVERRRTVERLEWTFGGTTLTG
jgi:hypothetical protein